jgi:acyl-CoA synthetase (AMP-forming)/AMP-acid ligase II
MLAAIAHEAAQRFGDRPVLCIEPGLGVGPTRNLEPGRDAIAARGSVDAPDSTGTPPSPNLSYAELDARAAVVAEAWRVDGVRPNDVVAITRRSDAGHLVARVAAARIGAIVAGINPSLTAAEIQPLLDLVEPKLIVDDHNEVLASAAERTRMGARTEAPDFQPSLDDPAIIVFTSGTTGRPKGAWFTHRALHAAEAIDRGAAAGQWDGGGALLASTQFAHVGVSTKLNWYLRAGHTLVRVEPWKADAVLEAVARHRIAAIGGVAPQMALLLRSPLLDRLDLTCVTDIVMGGAASPAALVAEATQRLDARYSIRYSSTESGGVGLATDPAASDESRLHTIGVPRPGVTAEVRDRSSGHPLPDGEVGELCVRSAAQMSGYWNNPEATAATLRSGWVHTGDLAERGPDGAFTLRGRISEQYIRGGYNVSPGEVEGVLSSHPAVDQIAIAVRPDPVMGEIGVAVVVPAEGADAPDLEALREFGAERLARWKLPDDLVVVDTLPLTSMHKLNRVALDQLAR